MIVKLIMLRVLFGLFAILSLVLSILTSYFNDIAYISIFTIVCMFGILVVEIPENLKFARFTYSNLLLDGVVFIFIVIITYAIEYYNIGLLHENIIVYSFYDSLYFSITTWTTLGYGDYLPHPDYKLVSSSQAIIGTLSMPLVFALIWYYCDSRIPDETIYDLNNRLYNGKGEKRKENKGMGLIIDSSEELCIEVDEDGNEIKFSHKYLLNKCQICGSSVEIKQRIDIRSVFGPQRKFGIVCECGNAETYYNTSWQLVRKWNSKNK